VTWDAQTVRDALDDVHVEQLASTCDDFTDSAGRQLASPGDHRWVETSR
jgi:hypothetical protein